MKKLNHPNVVKLVEVLDKDDDDVIYIVMEYVGNGSLLKAMSNKYKKPSKGTIWNYFRDILKGLLYLHEEAGVVHRDIKPENLLISNDNKIKIADFG